MQIPGLPAWGRALGCISQDSEAIQDYSVWAPADLYRTASLRLMRARVHSKGLKITLSSKRPQSIVPESRHLINMHLSDPELSVAADDTNILGCGHERRGPEFWPCHFLDQQRLAGFIIQMG